jgi:hypothetical protein
MARTARTEADEAIDVTENVTDKVTSITRDVTGTAFETGREQQAGRPRARLSSARCLPIS